MGISVPTEEQDPFDFDVPFSQQSGDWIRDSQCVCKGICEGDDYMVWLEGFEAIEERSHGREESSGALDSYATGRFFRFKSVRDCELEIRGERREVGLEFFGFRCLSAREQSGFNTLIDESSENMPSIGEVMPDELRFENKGSHRSDTELATRQGIAKRPGNRSRRDCLRSFSEASPLRAEGD